MDIREWESGGWKRLAIALLRAIDPANREPVYLLSTNETSDYFAFTGGVIGVTSPLMCYAVQPLLQEQQSWAGYGFAAVIDMQHCAHQGLVDGIVLHEFCHHALDRGMLERARERMPHVIQAAEREGREPPQKPIVAGDQLPGRPWSVHCGST